MTTDTMNREITITRVFDVSREKVFAAFTEPEQLAKWWGPEGFTTSVESNDAREGGTFHFTMHGFGGDHPVEGVYLECEPPSRIVTESFAIGPDGEKILKAINTVVLVDTGGKTELTLTAAAEALVPDAAMALGGMEAGWTQSLQCLDDLFNDVLDRQMVIGRAIQAPREKVFAAFVDPENIGSWWGPGGFTITTEHMDVRPGGEWRFTMHGPDGVDYPNLITYEVIDAPRRLEYRHGDPTDADPAFQATVTFDDFMGMTALTMRAVFETAAQFKEVVEKYNAVEGGNQTLDRLEKLMAEG